MSVLKLWIGAQLVLYRMTTSGPKDNNLGQHKKLSKLTRSTEGGNSNSAKIAKESNDHVSTFEFLNTASKSLAPSVFSLGQREIDRWFFQERYYSRSSPASYSVETERVWHRE